MMLKYVIGSIFLFISAPLRYIVRREVRNLMNKPNLQIHSIHHKISNPNQNLSLALYQRAAQSTAEYIEKHMPRVVSVDDKFKLLQMAFKHANLEQAPLICEFGVYSGDTINHVAKLTHLQLFGFDSFEGLPEHWRDGFEKGHFNMAALPKVEKNVVLIKGWFDKTLPVFLNENTQNVGFLHIDCDLYSSTKTIFDLLSPRINIGTVIVFDEYFNYPNWQQDEYKAFHEFIEENQLKYEYIGYNRLHEQVAVKII